MADPKKLYLIDGSGYIFRAYYGIRPLSTSTGVPTNAVVGFARMIGKLIRSHQPDHLAVVFDTPTKTFRHAMYDLYKANRDAPPDDLIPQFGLIHELVEAMGIQEMAMPGYEADDVIATVAQQATAEDYEVVVVSADKDLMQLIRPGVSMYDPMKDKFYGRDEVIEKFGVPPELVSDALALAGDASDNIPGVPKVGPKTAAKLINQFGDVEAVIEGVKTIEKPKAAERSVTENVESARMSKKLTVLAYDAPVEFESGALHYQGADSDTLLAFLDSIEARNLIRDLKLDETSTGDKEKKAEASPPPTKKEPSEYRSVLTLKALDEEIEFAQTAGRVSVDLETTSIDASRADIVGVALCTPGHTAAYIPLAHRYLGVPPPTRLPNSPQEAQAHARRSEHR